MEQAILELESYQQGMIDQHNRINKMFAKDDQTEHTKKTALRIALRIECLNATINHLKKTWQKQLL